MLTIAMTIGVLAFTTDAHAAAKKPGKAGNVDAMFKKLDADSDGKLSKEEFAKTVTLGKKKAAADPAKAAKKAKKAAKSGSTDQEFSKLDTDKNGSLSLDEFKKFEAPKKK